MTYDMVNASTRPVPLIVYEDNLHTTQGSITQDVLDTFTPSVGAGLAVANEMLIMLRDEKIRDQCLFSLGGYRYTRDDGKTALIWGTTRDMGVTDRKRPQFLALKLANEALAGDMMVTAQSGDDPTWNEPLTNRIQLNNVHYVQSFAFLNGTRRALVIFNFHRTAALDVTFAGANAPAGSVTIKQLTSANITDTNESAENVVVTTQTAANFDPIATMTLPPFSITLITSNSTSSATLRKAGEDDGEGNGKGIDSARAIDASLQVRTSRVRSDD